MAAEHRKRPDCGFSLVEVIVAMSLISLIAIALANVGTGSVQVFKRGQSIIARDTEIALTRQRLFEVLSVQKIEALELNGIRHGTSQTLLWQAAARAQQSQCEFYTYSLTIEPTLQQQDGSGSRNIILKSQCLTGRGSDQLEAIGQNLPEIAFSLTPRHSLNSKTGSKRLIFRAFGCSVVETQVTVILTVAGRISICPCH